MCRTRLCSSTRRIAAGKRSCAQCSEARARRVPLLIRGIDVDRSIRVRNFSGESVTHREFAKQHGVRRVPTLIVFDADGKPAAPPISGLLTDEFYRLHIEQVIEAGLHKMRPGGH